MARVGINPFYGRRYIADYMPLTMVVITHIPSVEGYYQEAIEIAEISLRSMVRYASDDFQLLIVDNGSCNEWRTRLLQLPYVDQYLLLRCNIGKIDAQRLAFGLVHTPLVGYSDPDVLFYPGWLLAELEVLRTFPEAALVGGYPVVSLFEHFPVQNRTPPPYCDVVRLTFDQFPEEWIDDHLVATGTSREHYYEAHKDAPVAYVERFGTKAWLHGHHMQFIGWTEPIRYHLPQSYGLLMGQAKGLNYALDAAGCLQLTTYERVVRHIGNRLDDNLRQEVDGMALS